MCVCVCVYNMELYISDAMLCCTKDKLEIHTHTHTHTHTYIYIYIYIYIYKINLNRESEIIIGSTCVKHSCNCSIAGFTEGFSFLLTNWLRIPWFFSRGRTRLAFSFFLTYNFFFFPRVVIRDTFISCSWRSFFFFVFCFWYRECW